MDINELTPRPDYYPMVIRYYLTNSRSTNIVDDGGYFKNTEDNSVIGLAHYELPDLTDPPRSDNYISRFTRSELISYVLDVHTRKPYKIKM